MATVYINILNCFLKRWPHLSGIWKLSVWNFCAQPQWIFFFFLGWKLCVALMVIISETSVWRQHVIVGPHPPSLCHCVLVVSCIWHLHLGKLQAKHSSAKPLCIVSLPTDLGNRDYYWCIRMVFIWHAVFSGKSPTCIIVFGTFEPFAAELSMFKGRDEETYTCVYGHWISPLLLCSLRSDSCVLYHRLSGCIGINSFVASGYMALLFLWIHAW